MPNENGMLEIVAGWDPKELLGFQIAQFSAIRRTSQPIRFVPLIEKALRFKGLYRRAHEDRDGQLWCPISNAPMSTSFANSRFLTQWLVEGSWALYCDFADMLFLADPAELFALADDRYAVMVVKREHIAQEQMKMDGQKQTNYLRKNWSSVILWNCKHPANRKLTVDMVNELPGRDLHRFCWLEDDEIGSLPLDWNFLVGIDPESEAEINIRPKLLHYTLGIPETTGEKSGPWFAPWFSELSVLDSTRNKVN